MLASSISTLSSSSTISQLRTIGLGILAGDGGLWIGEKHNPMGWFTPSKDWEEWTKIVLAECSDVLQAAGVLEAARVTAKAVPCKSKESCRRSWNHFVLRPTLSSLLILN